MSFSCACSAQLAVRGEREFAANLRYKSKHHPSTPAKTRHAESLVRWSFRPGGALHKPFRCSSLEQGLLCFKPCAGRLVKELASYETEAKENEARVQKMRDDGKDSYDIRKQEEVRIPVLLWRQSPTGVIKWHLLFAVCSAGIACQSIGL